MPTGWRYKYRGARCGSAARFDRWPGKSPCIDWRSALTKRKKCCLPPWSNTTPAQGRYEASRVKRALALIRDHAAILQMHEKNAAASAGQRSRAGKRRPSSQGETVELNARVALGGKIATLQVYFEVYIYIYGWRCELVRCFLLFSGGKADDAVLLSGVDGAETQHTSDKRIPTQSVSGVRACTA